MNDQRYWTDNPNPDGVARSAGWRTAVWILVGVVFFGLLGAGIWAFQVATSDVKGRGDAVRIKNDAPNRIAAQERAVVLYEELKMADAKLDVLSAAAAANPDDKIVQTQYTGSVSYCLGVIAEYNAHTQKYRSIDFIPVDLPPLR